LIGPYAADAFPITVKNGLFANFSFGIFAETNVPDAPLTGIER
jgi:hypothetical protein